MKAKKSLLLMIPILALGSGASTDVDQEVESLRQENEELREEIEELERKNSALSRAIYGENRQFYNANIRKLDEGGWKDVGGELEVHARTFPFRGGEFSAVRVGKKSLFFGQVKSRTANAITLTNRPFGLPKDMLLFGDIVTTYARSSTIEIRGNGDVAILGPMTAYKFD